MAVDFCDYFWGEKNNGFDTLYHNMKFGLAASKELSEFFRERSSIEEGYSKQLSRLAKQCGSTTGGNVSTSSNSSAQQNPAANTPICTFTPLWQLIKSSCEKLGLLQLQVSQKLADLVKDMAKYSDELAKKHKVVKESESITVEAIQVLNQTTTILQRAKETYVQRGAELLKLRKDPSTSAKDLERAEVKFRKATEDYKTLVEKHAQQREDFERKMTVSCRHFQEVEEGHVSQMRNFINSYINVLCNNYESMGQAHVDLRQQWDDLTAEKLLEIFVVSKMTGLEKPSAVEFEEFPMDTAVLVNLTPQQLPEYLEESAPAVSAAVKVKEDNSKNKKKPLETKTKKDKKDSKSNEGPSRRATSLLNLFTSSTSSPNTQGRGKGKNKRKSRPLEDQDQRAEFAVPEGVGRGGSAPPTPSEATATTHHHPSPTLWSRTSLRGSKSDDSTPQSSASSSAPPTASGLGIASWTAGFLKSRRDRKKEKEKVRDRDKKTLKKKRDSDAGSVKSESDLQAAVERERDREREQREEAPQAPGPLEVNDDHEVDEEGYRIRPKEENITAEKSTAGFYSSSDSDSDDEPERKLHVEIKPLSNGAAQSSVSVDELRATIENLNITTSMFNTSARKNASMDMSQNSTSQLNLGKSSIDLVGINFFPSPTNSHTSTLVAGPPHGGLTSPTGNASPLHRNNTATPVAEDLFAEIGEIVPALPPKHGRPPPTGSRGGTPTLGTIAIPRPPSRRGSEMVSNRMVAASPLTLQSSTSATASPTMALTSRTESMGSLESRPGAPLSPVSSLSRSSSRSAGPSPLTVSASTGGQTSADAIPLAVAFQEVVHAFFRGADESRCQVKIEGDMLLSFPAGLVQLLDTQLTSIPQIVFRIKNYNTLENVIPNRQLVSMEQDLMSPEPEFHFNMEALTLLLKRHVEQNPTAAFFNVTILKYGVKAKSGALSAPLQLVSYWKCEESHTDLRVDYKFNNHAQANQAVLRKLQISVPVEGGVTSMQSKPQGQWLPETNRAMWVLSDLSGEVDGSNVGGLRARFALKHGPGSPTNITAQFACDGSTLSGAEFELVSAGYRISLAKRRYVSGKYICDTDVDMRNRYAAPMSSATSTEC